MRVEIRPQIESDWLQVRAFLAQHWSPTHPILDRNLFDWQYRGFGDASETNGPLLLFDKSDLCGFLGRIPGTFQVNRPAAAEIAGHALAMWLVRPDLQQAGLGVLLLDEAARDSEINICLGVNAAASAIYARRGYRSLSALTRWIAPLESSAYAELCCAPPPRAPLDSWQQSVARELDGTDAQLPDSRWDAERLAACWHHATRKDTRWTVQGLARTAGFWRWRYAEAPGNAYRCWTSAARSAAVIARVEPVPSVDASVLRIIELIPSSAASWQGDAATVDLELIKLLRGALSHARDVGCVAADYQVSGSLLSSTLHAAGLRPQQEARASEPLTSLMPVFNPPMREKPPINVVWRSAGAFCDQAPWLFAKSDGDMDRPDLSSTGSPSATGQDAEPNVTEASLS